MANKRPYFPTVADQLAPLSDDPPRQFPAYTSDPGYGYPVPPVNELGDTTVRIKAGQKRVIAHLDAHGNVTKVYDDSQEERVTDPDTGGSKGQKLARFSSIPRDVLWELAEHFGKGERKYPNDPKTGKPNWQKGYDWRLNIDALERHLSQWLMGEDIDPETGSNHLIAVIWHAMVLRWFQIHGKGKDTR